MPQGAPLLMHMKGNTLFNYLKMNPKISIVIPVYGVEPYIEKCARSLFGQTLDDLEFIFVDDCTKDQSIEVVKKVLLEYPHREEQTIFIKHKCNKGLPSARKTGILAAKGEYIYHCDSDDWVDVRFCEEMYQKAVDDNYDILISDYYVTIDGVDTQKAGSSSLDCLTKEKIVLLLLSGKIPFMVWNKLIKNDIYKQIEDYPISTHAEDLGLILQLAFFAKKIGYLPKAYYHYIADSNTAIHQLNEEKYLKNFYESIGNAKLVEDFYRKHSAFDQFKNGIVYMKLIQRDRLLPIINDSKYYMLWKQTFPEINSHIIFNPEISLVHKIKYLLIKFRLSFLINLLDRRHPAL